MGDQEVRTALKVSRRGMIHKAGPMASENKLKPTPSSVADFIAAVEHPVRRGDALTLCRMMEEVSGEPPVEPLDYRVPPLSLSIRKWPRRCRGADRVFAAQSQPHHLHRAGL